MSAWTPGPWRAFYKRKYDEWHVSLPGSGLRVALCSDGIISENPEADANLIASAPDLAEALEEMLAAHSMENIGVDASMRRTNAKKNARAALRRAKGEA